MSHDFDKINVSLYEIYIIKHLKIVLLISVYSIFIIVLIMLDGKQINRQICLKTFQYDNWAIYYFLTPPPPTPTPNPYVLDF